MRKIKSVILRSWDGTGGRGRPFSEWLDDINDKRQLDVHNLSRLAQASNWMETVNKVCNGQLWALCPSTLMMMIIACKFFWKTGSVLKVIRMILHYLHTHHKCHAIHRKFALRIKKLPTPISTQFSPTWLTVCCPKWPLLPCQHPPFSWSIYIFNSCFTSHCHTPFTLSVTVIIHSQWVIFFHLYHTIQIHFLLFQHGRNWDIKMLFSNVAQCTESLWLCLKSSFTTAVPFSMLFTIFNTWWVIANYSVTGLWHWLLVSTSASVHLQHFIYFWAKWHVSNVVGCSQL